MRRIFKLLKRIFCNHEWRVRYVDADKFIFGDPYKFQVDFICIECGDYRREEVVDLSGGKWDDMYYTCKNMREIVYEEVKEELK